MRAAVELVCRALRVALMFGALLASTALCHAQITFRSVSSAKLSYTNIDSWIGFGSVATAASGNVVPSVGYLQPGDLLLAVIESRDNVVSTMPADWTLLEQGAGAGGLHRMSVFWKFAVSGEAAPTVFHPGGGRIIARIFRFRGVDPGMPFDVAPSFTGSASDLTTEADAIVSANRSLLVFLAGVGEVGTFTTNLSGSPGWMAVSADSAGSAGNGVAIHFFYSYGMRDPGTQAALTLTRSIGSAESHGTQIALRPNRNLRVDKPAGTLAGDVMVASLVYASGTVVEAAPAGWSLVRRTQNSGSVQAVYWKAAGAAEPAQYTWTLETTSGAAIAVQSFSGADSANPIAAEAGQTTPSGYTHATPSIDTTVANTMLVASHAIYASGPWTPPAGMNETSDQSTSGQGAGVSIETSYVLQAAAGPTGPKAATADGTYPGNVGHAHLLALRPPSVSANVFYIHVDHLNTPRLVADSTGTTVWRWDQQEPFANDSPNEDPGNTGAVFSFPLRFPGQYADKETNLAYNRTRDYDAAIGGYKQSDRIGLRGGLNTYSYVRSSPLRYTDPSGEFVFVIPLAIVAGEVLADYAVAVIGLTAGAIIANAINSRTDTGSSSASSSSAASSATSPCPADRPDCQEHFTRCLSSSLADLSGSVYGSNRCLLCRDACVRGGGVWPDIAMTGGRSVRCDYWNFK